MKPRRLWMAPTTLLCYAEGMGNGALAKVATTVLCGVALLLGGGLYLWKMRLLDFAQRPSRQHDFSSKLVEVPLGSTPAQVGALLAQQGVVDDEKTFARWLQYVDGSAASLKAGTYEVSPSMTPREIVEMLVRGRDHEVRFTVPEGLRKEEVAKIIADAGFGTVDDIVATMERPELKAHFGVPQVGADGTHGVPGGVEGYLFPDTYQFAPGTPVEQILKRMRRRLEEVLNDKLRARMDELGWDLHKALTLAAIIEEETGKSSERAHISSVFHNRLNKGMKLQTDPTVIYACDDYDGVIKKKHLQREHPYNTYLIPGLPPGPIAQPGKAAIVAALFPTKSKDLFFVAMGDSGTHVFCPDLACHTQAAQQWQDTR